MFELKISVISIPTLKKLLRQYCGVAVGSNYLSVIGDNLSYLALGNIF